MNGSVRVAVVNEDGQTFVDDLNAGDVWYVVPLEHELRVSLRFCRRQASTWNNLSNMS